MAVVKLFFVFKQKTAYEMRISDWSADVCSSDLHGTHRLVDQEIEIPQGLRTGAERRQRCRPVAVFRLAAIRREELDLEPCGVDEGGRSGKIGRASCRVRVCQYVSISVVAV